MQERVIPARVTRAKRWQAAQRKADNLAQSGLIHKFRDLGPQRTHPHAGKTLQSARIAHLAASKYPTPKPVSKRASKRGGRR